MVLRPVWFLSDDAHPTYIVSDVNGAALDASADPPARTDRVHGVPSKPVLIQQIPATRFEAPYMVYVGTRAYAGLTMSLGYPDIPTDVVFDYTVSGHWLFILCDKGIVRKMHIDSESNDPEVRRYGFRFRDNIEDTPTRAYNESGLRTMDESDARAFREFFDKHMVSPKIPKAEKSVFPADSRFIHVEPAPLSVFASHADTDAIDASDFLTSQYYAAPVHITCANISGSYVRLSCGSFVCSPRYGLLESGQLVPPAPGASLVSL